MGTQLPKRILITGEAGRGKTTLAKALSDHLSIKHYEMDDFFWKTKYSEFWPIEKSRAELLEIYKQDQWIVDGTTRLLMIDGLERADLVIHMEFDWIIHQYFRLIKRHLTRRSGKLKELLILLKHITFKRYKLFYAKDEPSMREMLRPYDKKVVHLHYKQDIKKWIEQAFPQSNQ